MVTIWRGKVSWNTNYQTNATKLKSKIKTSEVAFFSLGSFPLKNFVHIYLYRVKIH